MNEYCLSASEIVPLCNAHNVCVGLEIMHNIVSTRKRGSELQEIDFQMNFWNVSWGLTARY